MELNLDLETQKAIRLLTDDYRKTWYEVRKDPKVKEQPISNYEKKEIKKFLKYAREKKRRE
jgi:hypothetical protein